jgi:hypothetical protein
MWKNKVEIITGIGFKDAFSSFHKFMPLDFGKFKIIHYKATSK